MIGIILVFLCNSHCIVYTGCTNSIPRVERIFFHILTNMCYFNTQHSNWIEMAPVLICMFLLDNGSILGVYLLTISLYCFWEIPVQILGPLRNWILLDFSSIFILIKPLSQKQLVNGFSCQLSLRSVDCLWCRSI